jgi:hypothetical protein
MDSVLRASQRRRAPCCRDMKANLRSRNIAINSYVGMLAITVVGAFAVLFILHIANDIPLKTYFTADAYAIDSIQ